MVKKKGRCASKNRPTEVDEPKELVRAPHTFVIHRGIGCTALLELTKDFRRIMEPYTAKNLKERKSNTIKDFVSLSGVLHVSHICIFQKSLADLSFKIGRFPKGPTLTFKVHQFCLAKDVISSLKKQYIEESAFQHSPLVILNNFSGEGHHMKLMANTFQNMFPSINLTTIQLATIRRCVLFSYNSLTKLIDVRHYVIKVAPVGLSKGIKKVVLGKVPNLGKCNEIGDFITHEQCASDSEFEEDDTNQVEISQKLKDRGTLINSKSAIKLFEIGPRLTMQLIKVEEGLLNGEVLFHEFIKKSEEEIEEIKKRREERKILKETRKRVQTENKLKKDLVKEDKKVKSKGDMKKEVDRKLIAESNENMDSEPEDDVQYYRDEVGEEPETELFSAPQRQRKSFKPKMNQFRDAKKRKMTLNKKDGSEKRRKFDKNDSNSDNRNGNKKFKQSGGKKKRNTRTRR